MKLCRHKWGLTTIVLDRFRLKCSKCGKVATIARDIEDAFLHGYCGLHYAKGLFGTGRLTLVTFCFGGKKKNFVISSLRGMDFDVPKFKKCLRRYMLEHGQNEKV